MAISVRFILFLFISIGNCAPNPTQLVADLLSLQSQSNSGVIHLDDHKVSRFLTSTTSLRPFSLLIFFDAHHLRHNPVLRLPDLRRDFSILASSFIANHPNTSSPSHSKLFFCDVEFNESQHTFSLFAVHSLPEIRLVSPNVTNFNDSEAMDQSYFSKMAEFVESRTNLSVGPIHHPPFLSRNQMSALLVFLLIWCPFMIKKLLKVEALIQEPTIWAVGAVLVYFFSVSGGMHNVINKMPIFLGDPSNLSKVVFFYQESGVQLGAEGFAVGFLYTVVGVLLGVLSHGVVMVKDVKVQRCVVVVVLVVSVWSVKKVVDLDNWKTGYEVHGFWPSSWK